MNKVVLGLRLQELRPSRVGARAKKSSVVRGSKIETFTHREIEMARELSLTSIALVFTNDRDVKKVTRKTSPCLYINCDDISHFDGSPSSSCLGSEDAMPRGLASASNHLKPTQSFPTHSASASRFLLCSLHQGHHLHCNSQSPPQCLPETPRPASSTSHSVTVLSSLLTDTLQPRSRLGRSWSCWQAQEASRWSRYGWWPAPPPYQPRQVPSRLLRKGRNEILPQAAKPVLEARHQPRQGATN